MSIEKSNKELASEQFCNSVSELVWRSDTGKPRAHLVFLAGTRDHRGCPRGADGLDVDLALWVLERQEARWHDGHWIYLVRHMRERGDLMWDLSADN